MRSEFDDYLRSRFALDPAAAAQIARAMIAQLRERNFILSRYGGELYGFVHRAFMEHFCAEAYRWQFEKDRVLSPDQLKVDVYGRHWDDPAWHEILRLIAATIHEQWVAQIVTYLADEVNLPWPRRFGDHPPWNIALATQCLAQARTFVGLDHAGERILVRVIQLLEHSLLDNDDSSNDLIGSEILPALAAAGPSWPGRAIYLRWYLMHGVRLAGSSISGLATRIATSLFPTDPALLQGISDAIHAISDPRLRAPLIEAMSTYAHANPQVRALLASRAADDADVAVRQAALGALANLAADDPQVRALLASRAADDADAAVRRA